ncbi:hypothetical protein SAMN05421806_109151 [Streptomyces indicus]|uniref:Uncharacterized protein n=2 Tax=Streptomyces indicus TaxID=417292 RepID=A0A1G9DCU8_9ACTN|nr:hypothetical protein SAMN05421806_109151 [Streptomyces indicus]
MTGRSRTGAEVEELVARVRDAAGSSYTWRRHANGFDLTTEVPQATRRLTRQHTYEVALQPEANTFTLTDVVRIERQGPGGTWSKSVQRGRLRYRSVATAADGSGRRSFNSADGHRLIRDVTEELGWREVASRTERAGRFAGFLGGGIAAATLIAMAVVLLVR